MKRRLVALSAVIVLLQLTSTAQEAPHRRPELDAIQRLTFRNIGPTNQAGRVSVIVGVPGDPNTFYVAGANGGIFKTTNAGTTFAPLFDHQAVLSIGAIEIAPSNPEILYVGTGEENPRNNASFGNGVYRSNDAGATWTHLGLPDSDRIARIRIDRHESGYRLRLRDGARVGPERRTRRLQDDRRRQELEAHTVHRSADRLLRHRCRPEQLERDLRRHVDVSPLCVDARQRRQEDGALQVGGRRQHGLEEVDERHPGDARSIGVSVSRSEPSIVYMVSETPDEQGELWRSEDAGASWRMVNKDPNINFRPFYYADIRVDPNDPNRIYSLSGSLYMSEDAGRTFHTIGRDVHGDHQALWIDPANSKRVLSGSDGGFQVSYDGGKNFAVLNSVAFTQFYHINYDMQNPYMVCGGLQDNGTWCGPSNSLLTEGIRKNDWFTVGGGDGFFAVPDMKEPWRVYTDLQGGVISVIERAAGPPRRFRRTRTESDRSATPWRITSSATTGIRRSRSRRRTARPFTSAATCCSNPPTTASPGRRSARI